MPRNSDQLEIIEEMMVRQRAIETFVGFVEFMTREDPTFTALSRFQLRLCEVLQKVFERQTPFAAVSLPFAHGKSTICNKLFPAWCLGRNPNLRILTISHKKEMADDFSRDTREYLRSTNFKLLFPKVRLDPSAEAIGKWRVSFHRGFYQSAGITSGIQGKRFDMVIADDLIGNQEDAHSELIRDKVWRSFSIDVMSRLEPEGSALLVASRQHLDDPTGRIIEFNKKSGTERWEIFSFPAIAEINDSLGRKPGEALWPERFPVAKLAAMRDSGRFSRLEWEAMYQQNPLPEGGAIIKRDYWQVWTDLKLPVLIYKVLSVDTAFKLKQQNDYSAVTLWGVFRPHKEPLTWTQKVELIRQSDNSDRDLGYEFAVGPSIIRRIRRGEDINEPHYDRFDLDGYVPSWKQQNPMHLILIDAWQDRLSFPDLRRKIIAYVGEWQPDMVVVEDKASGQSLLQELAEAGIKAEAFNPGREDKVFRAKVGVEGVFEAGLVFGIGKRLEDANGKLIGRSYNEFNPAAELVVSECERFPHGTHDDLPDTVIQAIHMLRNYKTFELSEDELEDEEIGNVKVLLAN